MIGDRTTEEPTIDDNRSSRRPGIRIAVVAGAAALCSGLAVPALAHDASTATVAEHHQQLSFAAQKERALRMLAHEAGWLTTLKQQVAADDRLSADQRTAFTAKLDDALNRVATARAAVEAAGTRSDLRAALRQAELPYLGYPKQDLPSLADVKAGAVRFLDARTAWLTSLRSRVTADGRLTDQQRSAFLAKIDAALADLANAKDAVQAAGSRDAVRAALAGVQPWAGRYPSHDWRMHRESGDRSKTDATLTSARVGARQSMLVHRAGDPNRATRHHCDGNWNGSGDRSGYRDRGSDGTWNGTWSGYRDGSRHHHHDGGWLG